MKIRMAGRLGRLLTVAVVSVAAAGVAVFGVANPAAAVSCTGPSVSGVGFAEVGSGVGYVGTESGVGVIGVTSGVGYASYGLYYAVQHSTTTANMRTGPSTSCTAIGTASPSQNLTYVCYTGGNPVTVDGGTYYTWTWLYNINTDRYGWVLDHYLQGYGSNTPCSYY